MIDAHLNMTTKSALSPSAVRIAPRRDPKTSRTVCAFQPASTPDQVDLFTATGVFAGTAAAADWPADPAPAAPAAAAEAPQAPGEPAADA